jgi:hypothetical protein
MTIARVVGVMATMFRARWLLTLFILELAFRIVLLSAIFMRSGAPPHAKALLPGSAAFRG